MTRKEHLERMQRLAKRRATIATRNGDEQAAALNRARLDALQAQDKRDAEGDHVIAMRNAEAVAKARIAAEQAALSKADHAAIREACERRDRAKREAFARAPLTYLDVVREAIRLGLGYPSPDQWRATRAKVAQGVCNA